MKRTQKKYSFKYIKQEYESLSKEHRVALIYAAMDILEIQENKCLIQCTTIAMGYVKVDDKYYVKSGT